MKIKITTSCFGTKFRYSAGDVAEVSDKLGKDSMDGDNNAVDA